jgi:hypothetical protein
VSILWSVRRSRLLLGGLALVIALLVTGCGGGGGGSGASVSGGGTPESAGFVPAGAAAYVYANTDFGGDQWQTLDALSKKFPNRQQLLTQIQSALQKHGLDWNTDVKPALGPDLGLAVLSLATSPSPLAVTKPQDRAKLTALLAKLQASDPNAKPLLAETIDDWVGISDRQASLDAARAAHAGDSLADSSTFQGAMSELPDDALAKAYVDGVALNRALRASGKGSSLSTLTGVPAWIAASLVAKDNGIALAAISKGQNQAAPTSFKATLLDKVPSGALVYGGFDNLASAIDQLAQNPSVQSYLGQVEQSFGVTVAQLAALFKGEGAIYARPGTPIPEATIALKVDDEQTALATLDKLAARAAEGLHGQVQHQTIDGVEARRIQLPQFAIYYAAFDGLLVVTDSPTGITGLKDGGQKMSDDPVFKDVKDAAGMPDETKGFLYVNVKDTVPLVEGLSALGGGGQIPPDVSANLEHVRAFLAYGSGSGDENRLDAFLQVQ